MTRSAILIAWVTGRYALGWRGAFALWILKPAIEEAIIRENNL